jgi:hypothetical protein
LVAVDGPIDQAGTPECRIETIRGMTEVCLCRRSPQTGIDTDKQESAASTEKIGDGTIPMSLQLFLGEAHRATIKAPSDEPNPGTADLPVDDFARDFVSSPTAREAGAWTRNYYGALTSPSPTSRHPIPV